MYNESHYNIDEVNYLKVAKYVVKNITFNDFHKLTQNEQTKLVNTANQLHQMNKKYYMNVIDDNNNVTKVSDWEIELFINIDEPHSGDYTPYFCNDDMNDIKEYLNDLGYKLQEIK